MWLSRARQSRRQVMRRPGQPKTCFRWGYPEEWDRKFERRINLRSYLSSSRNCRQAVIQQVVIILFSHTNYGKVLIAPLICAAPVCGIIHSI